MYKTVAEIREANARSEQKWFAPDTMRWWRSQVLPGVMRGRYFVTSEQMDDDSPRLYTIRVADDNGWIDTVGDFQAYRTAANARDAIRRLPDEVD